MTFDAVIMVDWSGGNDTGPKPRKDAIWTCVARDGRADAPVYHRNRQLAEPAIIAEITRLRSEGARVLVGFDLCFAFPAGFAERLVGAPDPLAVWDWFADAVEDAPEANNRFELAGQINGLFPGVGPFWFHPVGRDIKYLPMKGRDRADHGLAEKRAADLAAKGAFSPWQLGGAGAVGGQVITGMPVLSRLRRHFGKDLCVWPFEGADADIVLAETYFSILPDALSVEVHDIKDAAQVSLFARAFSSLGESDWAALLDHPPSEEGWVLGVDQVSRLEAAASAPPPLRNDCFAMPRGAHWTPVDDALAHLEAQLRPVTGIETIPISEAAGRVLGRDVSAQRSHPPTPNAAVDGYGLQGPAPAGAQTWPLIPGRAAAGQPFVGKVPLGHAVRVLTGAALPTGVDTVILQEDVTSGADSIAFHGPLKKGANARAAGEDVIADAVILQAGRRLTPADVATSVATGVAAVEVRRPLAVGVLSTGDELRPAGADASDAEIYDANRPMLLSDIVRWGHTAIDLGHAPDDRKALGDILTRAASQVDVIITSGGASGGDEDHVSTLLSGTGSFALWRIAVKPGRPLAMGLWGGVPVIGVPGNPVAAQVCALVFARPALAHLSGEAYLPPQGYPLPAAFQKSKKAGRREYLRGRVVDGKVEIFPSEGSGRISGLSWATGLVELPDEALDIKPGDAVRFIPFGDFGL